MKGRILLLVQLAVSLGILVYFLSTIDFREAFRPIPNSGWIFFLATALLANLDRVLMAFKWNLLVRVQGIRVPFREALRSYYFGTFWGIVLPSSVGGDAVRIYRISSLTGAPRSILSSVVVERILGVLSVLTMVLMGAGLYLAYFRRGSLTLLVGVAALLAAGWFLFWVSLRVTLPARLQGWLAARTGRWGERLQGLVSAHQIYRYHPGAVFRFLGLSVLEQGIPVACTYLVARGLGLPIPLLVFLMFTPLVMGLSRIPISFDGFGIREGMYVYSLGQAGVPAADALVVGFLSHLVGNLSVLPGYLWSLSPAPTANVIPAGPADLPKP